MDRLNFNHLYYFYIVSKEGSIKASAEKLHVSQPTISDQIKLLEQYLECKLFERKNRSLTLTADGEVALKYATEIFDKAVELSDLLKSKRNLPKLSLDIGISNSLFAYSIYDSIISLFSNNETNIKSKEDQRAQLLSELEDGKLDIVFTDHKDHLLGSMLSYKVNTNKVYAVAHQSFRKYKKAFPESLNNISFFNYAKDSLLKNEIELFFAKNKITPRIIGEADRFELFKAIVEKGHGFIIVPEIAKNILCQNKELIVLGELVDFETSIWAIVNKKNTELNNRLLEQIIKKR